MPIVNRMSGVMRGASAGNANVGGEVLARRRSLMSDQLKYELAQELGFAHKVQHGDWGNITTREAGNLVKAAIMRAEQQLASGVPMPPDPRFRR